MSQHMPSRDPLQPDPRRTAWPKLTMVGQTLVVGVFAVIALLLTYGAWTTAGDTTNCGPPEHSPCSAFQDSPILAHVMTIVSLVLQGIAVVLYVRSLRLARVPGRDSTSRRCRYVAMLLLAAILIFSAYQLT